MGAIFVLFVRRFRQPAWRPLRGFLFSFMASSAFYPIIYAGFLKKYSQIDYRGWSFTVRSHSTCVRHCGHFL